MVEDDAMLLEVTDAILGFAGIQHSSANLQKNYKCHRGLKLPARALYGILVYNRELGTG